MTRTLIFDLDGTLINSAPDVRHAVNHTLQRYGHSPIAEQDIYELLGYGARVLLAKAFAKHHVTLSADEMEESLSAYYDYYKKHPVVATEIYSGVIDVLTLLKNAGFALGICTNKPGIMTRLVLEKLNMMHFFNAVVAGDEMAQPKPHAAHIKRVLELMGLPSAQAVMIGDSEVDKQAAQNADIPFIGVSYGYDTQAFTSELMINHFSELPQTLTQIKGFSL
jgi:phosphoglycolate phosphatase